MAEIKTSVYRKLIKAGYSEEYAKYFDKIAFELIAMPDSDMRETMNIIAKQLNAVIVFDTDIQVVTNYIDDAGVMCYNVQ